MFLHLYGLRFQFATEKEECVCLICSMFMVVFVHMLSSIKIYKNSNHESGCMCCVVLNMDGLTLTVLKNNFGCCTLSLLVLSCSMK